VGGSAPPSGGRTPPRPCGSQTGAAARARSARRRQGARRLPQGQKSPQARRPLQGQKPVCHHRLGGGAGMAAEARWPQNQQLSRQVGLCRRVQRQQHQVLRRTSSFSSTPL
jgi:hypothetical protein